MFTYLLTYLPYTLMGYVGHFALMYDRWKYVFVVMCYSALALSIAVEMFEGKHDRFSG